MNDNPVAPSERPAASERPQRVFCGKVIEVNRERRRLPNGKVIEAEYAERSPGVRIIVTNGSRVLLTKEWRDELANWDFRVPGGKVFDSLEDYVRARTDSEHMTNAIRAAAAKELKEETGLELPENELVLVYKSTAGATVVWDLFYFVASINADLSSSQPETNVEGETIGREWLTPSEIFERFASESIAEERSAAVLVRLLLSPKGAEVGLPPPPQVTWPNSN